MQLHENRLELCAVSLCVQQDINSRFFCSMYRAAFSMAKYITDGNDSNGGKKAKSPSRIACIGIPPPNSLYGKWGARVRLGEGKVKAIYDRSSNEICPQTVRCNGAWRMFPAVCHRGSRHAGPCPRFQAFIETRAAARNERTSTARSVPSQWAASANAACVRGPIPAIFLNNGRYRMRHRG